MKQVYYDYDVYPKVFLGDREKTVTVQPLGIRTAFASDRTYTVEVLNLRATDRCYLSLFLRSQVWA